jgi:hypothetical protein
MGIAICALRAQSDTLSIERLFLEIDNVHLLSQHTQDFSFNRNYDYYILFYLDQINVIYSERQKYGINSLKIKQNFFQKNLWTGQF